MAFPPWALWSAGVILGLAIVFCGWWVWWVLPKWQVDKTRLPDPKQRADTEDNFRKTVGQLLGGIAAALIAASFTFFQAQSTRNQTLINDKISADQRITGLASKGFELVGSKEALQRLGGIYLLESAMRTSELYHRPVLEALSAFVRDLTKADTDETRNGPPSTEVQAVLTVIGRRSTDNTGIYVLLDLEHARIPRANLRGANFIYANLSDADLRDTNLRGASLNSAKLTGADLSDMNKDLTQAQLDKACGANVKLDAPLTIKPCP